MYTTQPGSSEGLLYKIGTATGAATSIGFLGVPEIRGLAIRPSTNEVYGTSPGSTTTSLYRISCDSGAAVRARIISVGDMSAIAFNAGDTLYGATSSGKLYRINLTSGEAVLLGTADNLSYWGLSFSPTSGKLWAAARHNDDSISVVSNC
jgi:DNA-binding beta-propeller fold protein YncE